MAKCRMCGDVAGFAMELCDSCQRSQAHAESERAARAVRTELADAKLEEGETAARIGNVIIWLSLFGSLICVFGFGRVSGAYGEKAVWNGVLVTMFIAAGLNGAFFGYLLSKVGSILIRLQKLTDSN